MLDLAERAGVDVGEVYSVDASRRTTAANAYVTGIGRTKRVVLYDTIWRWLGRQTRIEEGATSAAEASEQAPGESLFPVSLLLKAPIEDRKGRLLGTCVDAMAGCSSGRVRYVVASQGGIAGVGETLRRLPWNSASADTDKLVSSVDRFEGLAEIEKDQWPVR